MNHEENQKPTTVSRKCSSGVLSDTHTRRRKSLNFAIVTKKTFVKWNSGRSGNSGRGCRKTSSGNFGRRFDAALLELLETGEPRAYSTKEIADFVGCKPHVIEQIQLSALDKLATALGEISKGEIHLKLPIL